MFKRKRIILPALFLIIAGFLLVSFIKRQYVVPIAMYHSISPQAQKGDRLTVTPASFERQMKFLRDNNYNIMPLSQVAILVKEKKKIPKKTIAITFDDGVKDNFVYAFPIIKKYNVPVTVFLIVSEVGRPQGDRLSWEDAKKMQDSGLVSFGSHTITHPWLPELTSDEILRKEIGGSKNIIEAKIGEKVDAFCYPGGRFNAKIKDIVIDSGYKLAVVTNPGKKIPNDDIFALKRIRISQNCDNLFIFWAETSGYYNFIRENRHK